MKQFTIVYTFPVGRSNLVAHKPATMVAGETWDKMLKRLMIDPSAVVLVFHGKHESIETDWSKL